MFALLFIVSTSIAIWAHIRSFLGENHLFSLVPQELLPPISCHANQPEPRRSMVAVRGQVLLPEQ